MKEAYEIDWAGGDIEFSAISAFNCNYPKEVNSLISTIKNIDLPESIKNKLMSLISENYFKVDQEQLKTYLTDSSIEIYDHGETTLDFSITIKENKIICKYYFYTNLVEYEITTFLGEVQERTKMKDVDDINIYYKEKSKFVKRKSLSSQIPYDNPVYQQKIYPNYNLLIGRSRYVPLDIDKEIIYAANTNEQEYKKLDATIKPVVNVDSLKMYITNNIKISKTVKGFLFNYLDACQKLDISQKDKAELIILLYQSLNDYYNISVENNTLIIHG